MNKQIVFCEKNVARLLDVEEKEPLAGEVKVRTCYTAISSGTERANLIGDPYTNGSIREAHVDFPRTVGYSGSGIVESVGEGVTSVKPGDRVVIYWGKHMLYNVLPENNVVLIDDKRVALEDASFVFISTFSLAAVRKLAIELGESCLIAGAGPLGLFALQYARLCGAMPVIVSDLKPERRELALKLGADIVLDPSEQRYESQIFELTNGKGVNTVIEVTGNPSAMEASLRVMARQGRIALLGCTRRPVAIDLYHDVHYPGIQIFGAHTGVRPQKESYPRHWTHYDDCRTALMYLSAGRLDIQTMISEIHSPTNAYEIFSRLAYDADFPTGVAFDWQQL